MEPRRIVKIAKSRGLAGIAVTDHNTIRGGVDAAKQAEYGFHVIVGSEIMTERGEIIGLFLNEEIRSTEPLEVIDCIRSQGGLSVLPHPFRSNILFRKPTKAAPLKIAEKVDAIEVFNARTPGSSNERALLLAREMNKPSVAGSDAHFYPEIGKARTVLPPFNSEEELRTKILEGKTTVERGSYAFASSLPFYILGFLYNRVHKISQRIR